MSWDSDDIPLEAFFHGDSAITCSTNGIILGCNATGIVVGVLLIEFI
jgi:hypothetical protein